MSRKIEVQILGDSSSLERAFARSERSARGFSRSMERAGRGSVAGAAGFQGLGRAVGTASVAFLGAAAAFSAVKFAAKVGFGELFAGQKVAAQTAAALKSTGRVAGVTAGQIDKLATSLQQLSGYDDEAVHSAENLMLTFTNVRNVAGKGNDVFNQATLAAANMSRTFDQDLSTSALQLGKALQDPVRGVTALRRAGVSFDERQKRLITRLVQTGRVLEAQKIILREVTRETGGAARAYGQTLPGQLDILRGNLENLAGDLAKTLAPEVDKLTKRFNAWLADPEHKKQVIGGFTTSVHALGAAAQFAAATVGALKSAWDKLPDFGKDKGLLKLLGARAPASQADQDALRQILTGTPPGMQGPLGKNRQFVPPGLEGPLTGAARPGTAPTPKPPKGISASQRNTWFDALINRQLGRVQDITSLRGQITRLNQIAGLVRGRLAVTNDITRRLTLEDKLADVLRTRKGVRGDLAAQIQQMAQAARDEKLGWIDFAVERAEATKTLKDDRRALQSREKFLQGLIRHEGRTLELVTELWRTRQKIRDLNKKQSDADPLAGLMQVSSKRLANMLAAGTGLGAAGRRVLGANIAGAEIRPIHVHSYLDGREVSHTVNRHNARGSHRTGNQTSGRLGP